jgi:2-methylisocitrate lyase-like PEP mutase family enzyme
MGLAIRARKTTPPVPPKDLEALGIKQVTYPRLFTAAALKGMKNALAVFENELVAQNRIVDRADLLVTFDEINDLMGLDTLEELEQRYSS